MLAALARLAAGREARLGVARLGAQGRRHEDRAAGLAAGAPAGVAAGSMEQNMGCAVGACLGCVVIGVDGPQRVCREGPVFAAEEIAWEDAA